MPYEISTDAAGCTSGYAVVKQEDGTPVPGGCHPTEKEALAHIAALEIALQDEGNTRMGTLPEQVAKRISDADREKLCDQRSTRRGKVDVEVRIAPAPKFTVNDQTWNLRGYATVYDVAYPIAGGPEAGGWLEIVERGATAKSIKDGADVRLLFDHEGIPLARTAAGTMRLLSDDMGMMVDAELDPESPYAQSVRSAVTRGDADQMSFAFRVLRQSWNEDYTERRIKEVQLFDASVVTYPASEATVVQMNSSNVNTEQRELDPEKEAMEDTIADQIRMLIGRLIEGEAQEMQSGSPVAKSLKALVDTLCALDWWQEVDHAEDAGTEMEHEYEDMGESEDMGMGEDRNAPVSVSLAQAQAEVLRLRAQHHAV